MINQIKGIDSRWFTVILVFALAAIVAFGVYGCEVETEQDRITDRGSLSMAESSQPERVTSATLIPLVFYCPENCYLKIYLPDGRRYLRDDSMSFDSPLPGLYSIVVVAANPGVPVDGMNIRINGSFAGKIIVAEEPTLWHDDDYPYEVETKLIYYSSTGNTR